jgi:hypothetical protein
MATFLVAQKLSDLNLKETCMTVVKSDPKFATLAMTSTSWLTIAQEYPVLAKEIVEAMVGTYKTSSNLPSTPYKSLYSHLNHSDPSTSKSETIENIKTDVVETKIKAPKIETLEK